MESSKNTKLIIIDLDNCICDDEWRIKHIDWTSDNPEKRYKHYHAAITHDAEAKNQHLFQTGSSVDRPVIVISTSRPYWTMDATNVWLRKNNVQAVFICMRKYNDHRSSVDIKQDAIHHIETAFPEIPKSQWMAYDDRQDIVDMYIANGIAAKVVKIHDTCAYTKPTMHPTMQPTITIQEEPAQAANAGELLGAMADCFRGKNAVYGDNYKLVGDIIKVMFPDGVPSELVYNAQWCLLELILVKLTRWTNSNLQHQDSIHDAAIYCAMAEAELLNQQNKDK